MADAPTDGHSRRETWLSTTTFFWGTLSKHMQVGIAAWANQGYLWKAGIINVFGHFDGQKNLLGFTQTGTHKRGDFNQVKMSTVGKIWQTKVASLGSHQLKSLVHIIVINLNNCWVAVIGPNWDDEPFGAAFDWNFVSLKLWQPWIPSKTFRKVHWGPLRMCKYMYIHVYII